MLEPIDKNIWHAVHHFVAYGVPITSRMTVVCLPDRKLLVHSPIPLTGEMRAQMDALGSVAFIVAPNLMHHLFLGPLAKAYPAAEVYGPNGLRKKRPDLVSLKDLPAAEHAPWLPDLEHMAFEGFPAGKESIWFHRPSATLIVTDLVQCWQDPLPWRATAYALLSGVRHQLAVPRTVRALVRDKQAAARSAKRLLEWPFTRVIVGHNSVVETGSHDLMASALQVF
ncbi:DUF4336 domain-containing protein [Ottowia thiooxydans]|uniref:DUF4336 domain-containing protein n=1 Tax=Ottowia thiooxydans TaxID=219182 RepID=A0ABV2Q490_9BURK